MSASGPPEPLEAPEVPDEPEPAPVETTLAEPPGVAVASSAGSPGEEPADISADPPGSEPADIRTEASGEGPDAPPTSTPDLFRVPAATPEPAVSGPALAEPPLRPEPPPLAVRAPKPPLDLTVTFRALALIFGCLLALGLGIWQWALGDDLLAFTTKNTLTAPRRLWMLATSGGVALLTTSVLGVLVLLRRGPRPERLFEIGSRLSPVILLALVPALWQWQAWKGDDLNFLVLVALVGLGGRMLFQAAFAAPPLFASAPFSRLRAPAFLRRHAPLAAVLLSICVYVAFFTHHTINYHLNLHSNSFDLGLENNLLWNLWKGDAEPFKTSPMFGPKGTHFGYHATAIAYLLAPIYALWQKPEMLLLMQSFFMGGAALPLFLFARRHLPAGAATCVALGYLLFPPLHGANLYDFHYLSLGPFFIWTTLYLADSGRIKSAFLLGFLTLSVREDVAASLGVVGLFLLFSGHRARTGLVMAIAGGGYFILMKLAIMPLIASKQTFTYMFKDMIPTGEKGFGGVIKTTIGNPTFTLDAIIEKKKFTYSLYFVVPMAFLPLRRAAGLFLFLPAFFFTLLSTGYAPLITPSFQYTAHWTGPLFVGVVLNLAWLERRAASHALGVVARRAAVASFALAMVLCSYQFGALLQQNTARGGFEAYLFSTSEKDATRRAAANKLLEQLPPDAKVAAGEKLVPQVSSRADAYTLRIGVFDAEYIFVEPAAEGADAKKRLREVMDKKTYGVIAAEPPFFLMKKGAPVTRNVEIEKAVGKKVGK